MINWKALNQEIDYINNLIGELNDKYDINCRLINQQQVEQLIITNIEVDDILETIKGGEVNAK